MVYSVIVSKETGEMISKCITTPILTRKHITIEGIPMMICHLKQYEVRMFHSKTERDEYFSIKG